MKKACMLMVLIGFARGAALAEMSMVGDMWVDGAVGVGTTAPAARLEAQADSSSEVVFQVSGVDETPFFYVNIDGDVGMSTHPAANLDISGAADVSNIGLQLRAGNMSPITSNHQVTFGYAGSANLRHAIVSSHSAEGINNSLSFYLWTSADGDSEIGTTEVFRVETTTLTSGGALHVNPVGRARAELAVSDGVTYAGGVIHRLNGVTPSSRNRKSDIQHIEAAERQGIYEAVRDLRHVAFRYKGPDDVPHGPLRRGLIYEEAPQSVRDPAGTVNLDQRVLNAEIALQELILRIGKTRERAKVLGGGQ